MSFDIELNASAHSDHAIAYAIGQTSLGPVLVARTRKGVCAILFESDRDALIRDLATQFPTAALLEGSAEGAGDVLQVVEFVESPKQDLALALDIRGSSFERRVWNAVRDVPLGSTLSYSDLARRLGYGFPNHATAVAHACAANVIALAIPCHRIVGKHNAIRGYRWGEDRKRALLERESHG